MDQDYTSHAADMADYFATLAAQETQLAIPTLVNNLRTKEQGTYDKHVAPRMAARALLQHGQEGVQTLIDLLPEAPGAIYPNAILEALWFAAKGQLGKDYFGVAARREELLTPPAPEAQSAAREALGDLIAESRNDETLFLFLIDFALDQAKEQGRSGASDFLAEVRSLFAEATIKLTPTLLNAFRSLIDQDLEEEQYQSFLAENPVLLDPLAAEMLPKQQLGLEHVTDFALRRVDDRWILVEIEKPQDRLFTKANDLTARFTHAYGQVIDFQRWVDEQNAYAEHLMPGIRRPRGLLVMGRRTALSPENAAKLKRFVANSESIDVFTFDDVLSQAQTLYENLYHR